MKDTLTNNETQTAESRTPDNEPSPRLDLKAVVLRTEDTLEVADQESIYHGNFPTIIWTPPKPIRFPFTS